MFSFIENIHEYSIRDTKYITSAVVVVIRRFDPSISSKDKNNTREQKKAVAPNKSFMYCVL